LFGGEGGAGRIDARKVEEEARVELMREEEKAVYVQEKRAVVEEEERVVERKKERRRKKEEEEDEKKRIVRMQLLREKQKREVKKQLKKSRRQKNNKKSKKSKKKKKKKKKNKKKKEEEQDEEQDAPTSSSSAQSPLLGVPTDYCKTTITISQLESGITYQYVHQHCCSPLFCVCVFLNLNDNTAIDTNTVFPPISHGIFFFNSTGTEYEHSTMWGGVVGAAPLCKPSPPKPPDRRYHRVCPCQVKPPFIVHRLIATVSAARSTCVPMLEKSIPD